MCQAAHGHPLPEGLTNADVQKINEVAFWEWVQYLKHKQFVKLG